MLLGVHCSIAGGYTNAVAEADRLGINAMQIFTKNQRFWKEKIVDKAEADQFKSAVEKSSLQIIFSHATYLINLASVDEKIKENSLIALASELQRCDALGLAFTVLHPGASKGLPVKQAIAAVAENINVVLRSLPGLRAKILLENTAGQGSCLGCDFDEISEMINLTDHKKVGFCLDTCHAFAAGYDIRTQDGVEDLLSEMDRKAGLNNLHCIHLNDSKGGLGSHLDRHEHIGKGKIGLVPFEYFINHFPHVPKVIELDKENNMDEVNLKVLRGLKASQ